MSEAFTGMSTLKTVLLVLFVLNLSSCKAPEPNDLHGAARMGSVRRVNKALEMGVNVNQIEDGRTALHTAVVAGKDEVVRLLIEKGADFTLPDNDGNTPWELVWSRNKGRLSKHEGECAVILLESGVKPKPLEETTYLHKAARMVDNSRLIKLLLESGLEVDARDKYGWTPLHVAANHARDENLLALLGADADPNAKTTETWVETYKKGESTFERFRYEAGSKPLDVAAWGGARRGGKSVRAILKEWGATENPDVKNKIESR